MKKLLTLSLAVALTAATPQLASALSDIANSKNKSAIEYLSEKGILSGYPDGTFRPQNTVNRAELLKILVGGKGAAPDTATYNNCFPDVAKEWFAPFVCYAKEQGWVGGYPDGTFRPANTVNTAEAIKMVVNAQGYAVPISVQSALYDDVNSEAWFAPYVQVAKDRGILEPTSGNLGVRSNMRRGGISEIIYRSMYISEKGLERFPEQSAAGTSTLSLGEYMSQLYALMTKAYGNADDMLQQYQTLPTRNVAITASLSTTLTDGKKSWKEMGRLLDKYNTTGSITKTEEAAFDTNAQDARDKVKDFEEQMTVLLGSVQSNSRASTANTSFPINLLNNQNWKVRIAAQFDEYTNGQEQVVFEVMRNGEAFTATSFTKSLKSGKLTRSDTEWKARFTTAYEPPKTPYLELYHCWYKYEYIMEGFSCEFHRVPVQMDQKTVKGDWSFEHLLTSADDEYEVEVLNKSTVEVQCNVRAETTEDGSKVYYTKDSLFFDKVGNGFWCFESEDSATKAGYHKSYQ